MLCVNLCVLVIEIESVCFVDLTLVIVTKDAAFVARGPAVAVAIVAAIGAQRCILSSLLLNRHVSVVSCSVSPFPHYFRSRQAFSAP